MGSRPFAVNIQKVTKTYRQGEDAIHALKNVNFEAKQGELMMIVGPSGSGKTTLLSVIAGILFFEEGEVEVLDHPLHKMNVKEIAEFRKKNIGFIFQLFNLIPTLTCEENVLIPLLLNGVKKPDAIKRAHNCLEQVGLGNRAKDHPQNLSGGQQQRVAIARALSHEPRLVICDEPTASLDAETGARVMTLLRDIVKSSGRSAIVVTHDNRIFPFADRVVHMNDGQIVETKENTHHL